MNAAGVWLLIAWLAFLAVGLRYVRAARGRSSLDRWARGRGFALQEATHAWTSTGDFARSRGGPRTHFRFVVLDHEGVVRRGWARTGGGFPFGFGPEVEVSWIDGVPAPAPPR